MSGLTPLQAEDVEFETHLTSYSDDELNSINANSRKMTKEEWRCSKDDAWVDIVVAHHLCHAATACVRSAVRSLSIFFSFFLLAAVLLTSLLSDDLACRPFHLATKLNSHSINDDVITTAGPSSISEWPQCFSDTFSLTPAATLLVLPLCLLNHSASLTKAKNFWVQS